MGIDISAKLIYGLPYSDLPEEILEEVDELLDGDLDYASPYYDAPREEWIVGVDVECSGVEIWELTNHLEDDVYRKIPECFGDFDLELGLYATPHVY